MKDRKVVALIVLGIGAVISLIYGITAPPKRRGRVSPGREAAYREKNLRPIEKIISTKRRAKKTKYEKWGRNPFAPKGLNDSQGMVLDGIMWQPENPKAIISGQVVGKGAKIGDKIVTDIKRNTVIIKDGAEEITLRLSD